MPVDRDLGAPSHWTAEKAAALLRAAVSATRSLLHGATGTDAIGWLLLPHLGLVLTPLMLAPNFKRAKGSFGLLS